MITRDVSSTENWDSKIAVWNGSDTDFGIKSSFTLVECYMHTVGRLEYDIGPEFWRLVLPRLHSLVCLQYSDDLRNISIAVCSALKAWLR